MELHDYLRLTREFEELIQNEPPHLRLGKTLEFVRNNFKPEDVFFTKKSKGCGDRIDMGQSGWMACGEYWGNKDDPNRILVLCEKCRGNHP